MTDKRLYEHLTESGADGPRVLANRLTRRNWLRLSLAAGMLGATSLLTACGDDDDDDDTDDTPGEDEGAADEPTATSAPSGGGDDEPTATEASDEDEGDDVDEPEPTPTEASSGDTGGSERDGGELVVLNEQSPVSLDPHFVRDVGSSRAMYFMYDGLIEVDEETELEPWLAQSWEISDDGMEYTLHLQTGVTFHDGTPFDAEAVKFNLERQWDESLNTLYYDDFVQYLDSVEVVDEQTVMFTLKELHAQFARFFLVPGSGQMISPTAVEEMGEEFAQAPVGTGPFKFSEFVRDSHLVMERYDDYWAGRPHLDSVRVRIVPEQSVQIVELEAKNAHVGFSVQAKDLARMEDAGVNVVNRPAPMAGWTSMNLAKGVTQELAVRQAITHAVDAAAIVSEFLGGYGAVSRGGAREGWPRYNEDIPLVEYDPELAGQILDEAGWVLGDGGVRERDGEQLKVNVLSTQLERALSYGLMNQVIQESLEQIGFATEIQTMEWGAYLDEFRAGEWWEVTWHAQNSDSFENAGATLDPDGYWNVNQHAKVEDPELAEVADQIRDLYRQMEQEVDQQGRIEIWAEVQKLCYEYALVGWLVHWDYLVAVQPEVQDLAVKPTIQDTLYKVHLAWLEG